MIILCCFVVFELGKGSKLVDCQYTISWRSFNHTFDNHKTLPSTLSMLMIQDLIFLLCFHKPINRLISGLLLL